jgi:hypothetical protein
LEVCASAKEIADADDCLRLNAAVRVAEGVLVDHALSSHLGLVAPLAIKQSRQILLRRGRSCPEAEVRSPGREPAAVAGFG